MLSRLRSLWNAAWRRPRMETEMEAELRFHMEAYSEDLVRSGLSRAEAWRRARIEFGGVESVKEDCRQALGLRLADELRQDLRYAARALRRSPGFTAAAVLSLALGIGANTAIFSVVNAALLRPLPYRHAERLVAVFENHATRGVAREQFANANFFDLRSAAKSLEDLAAYMPTGMSLTGVEPAEQVAGGIVTANAFALLGVPAQIGRALMPEDDSPGRPRAIVLSHKLWARRFGSGPRIAGRPITLDGRRYEIAGVMPPWFRIPVASHEDEFWVPARMDTKQKQERSNHNLVCFGRLRPGTTLRAAQTEAEAIFQRLRSDYPDTNAGISVNLLPLREALSGSSRRVLLVLLAAVCLVLLIACANVANLVLARSTTRSREIAVRAALGAGQLRIFRQLFTEVMLLAGLGGALGLALCLWASTALKRVLPQTLLPAGEISIDLRVLLFGLGAAFFTGVLCGLMPALAVSRRDGSGRLSGPSRSATGAASELRARNILVASEVALALVLLVGLSLLLRSFLRLLEVDPGVRADHALVVRFIPPQFIYRGHRDRVALLERVLARVQALPGVEAAGLVTLLPFTPEGGASWFTIEGQTPAHPERLIASNRLVSTDYFRAMGMALRRGRSFDEHDSEDAAPAAIINEAMARRFWPGRDPLGTRFKFGTAADEDRPWVRIVGIAGDVRQAGPASKAVPEVYRPFVQDSQGWLSPRALVVRTSIGPAALAPAVLRAIRETGKDIPIPAVNTLEELLSDSVAPRRVNLVLVGLFAAVAALLAMVGIYGIVAYAAVRRTREMAIRVAVGASRADVLGLLAGKGMIPVAAGVAVGLLLSLGLTRFMATLLYSVSPTDGVTFAAVPLAMLAVAAFACYVPARRASLLDAIAALKYD